MTDERKRWRRDREGVGRKSERQSREEEQEDKEEEGMMGQDGREEVSPSQREEKGEEEKK